MKKTKAKSPKRVSPPNAGEPPGDVQPVIDPVLLDDVAAFVHDPVLWFHTPNSEFEWRKPIHMLGTPDEARLRNRIEGAKYGMFS